VCEFEGVKKNEFPASSFILLQGKTKWANIVDGLLSWAKNPTILPLFGL